MSIPRTFQRVLESVLESADTGHPAPAVRPTRGLSQVPLGLIGIILPAEAEENFQVQHEVRDTVA